MQIVDIHSITTATDWVFDDGTSVACFALVSFGDERQGVGYVEKIVIPVSSEDIGTNLLGRFIEDFDMDVAYIGQS